MSPESTRCPATGHVRLGRVVLMYCATGRHPFAIDENDGDGDGDLAVDDELRIAAQPSAVLAPAVPAAPAAADGAEPQLSERRLASEASAAAAEEARRRRAARTAQRKRKEAKLNELTLTMPVEPLCRRMSDDLRSLLLAMVERDASARLSSAAQMRMHPLLRAIEWDLLEEQWLPAPYLPDPELVYVKDEVPPLSHVGDDAEDALGRRPEERGLSLDGWDYQVPAGSAEFAEELTEYVKKFAAVSAA